MRRSLLWILAAAPLFVASSWFSGGGARADDGDGGDAPAAPAPAGPGTVLDFPSWNLKWKVPASPEWKHQVAANEKDGDHLADFGLRLPGIKEPPPPGMPESDKVPMEGECVIHLHVNKAPAGKVPFELLSDANIQHELGEKNFDKYEMQRTQVMNDVTVGNWKGAAIQLVGTQGDGHRFLRIYLLQLRGLQYQWDVVMDGERNVDKVFKGALNDLLQGVEFPDTKEGIRGPVAASGVPDDVVSRGTPGDGKEETFSGISAKRPKEWHEIDGVQGERGHQFSWELRAPDDSSYQFLTLRVLPEADLMQQKIKFEDLVQSRESVWNQNVSEPVTVSKGKTAWFDSKFGLAKGVGYRFTGTFHDTPFVETGWVVKSHGLAFVIYHQYGGKDAEKAADKAAKAVDHYFRFEK
jgi:hypothetical protein